jgi:hypothetical protein
LPCFTTRALRSMVSRIRRSASSRIDCFDIRRTLSSEPLPERPYSTDIAFVDSGREKSCRPNPRRCGPRSRSSCGALRVNPALETAIASAAEQSSFGKASWIARSQVLLAMTKELVGAPFPCKERLAPHTVSTVDPVVLRAARSACALAASFSG